MIVNVALMAAVGPVAVAFRVYPLPLLSMLSVENTATPLTAATVVVPASVPPAGFVPIATATSPVKVVTVLPTGSWAVTWIAGVIVAPAAAVVGCTVNFNCDAEPTVMSNGVLTGELRPPVDAVSVKPVPLKAILSVENVATPETAAIDVVPDNVVPAVPVPGVIATDTVPVKLVTAFPPASCAATLTAGVMAAPAVVVTGCTEKTRRLAAPTSMVKAVLVAPVGPAAVAARVYPLPALSMLRPAKDAMPATAVTVVAPERVPPAGLV